LKTIITEQLVSYDINGLPKGILVKQSTFDDLDKHVSSEDIGFTVLSSQSIASIESARTQLEQDKAALQSIVQTLTEEKATLVGQKSAMQNQVTSLQQQLTDLPILQTNLANALALVELYRPYDPEKIRAKAFYQRLTTDQLFALADLALKDATAKSIFTLLSTYKASEDTEDPWPVLLNDPQVVGAFQYLMAAGVVSESQMQDLLRPATKDEAFYDEE
jgi:cell division septum initiation protein DivIVA